MVIKESNIVDYYQVIIDLNGEWLMYNQLRDFIVLYNNLARKMEQAWVVLGEPLRNSSDFSAPYFF